MNVMKTVFDKVYVITLITNKERQEFMSRQLKMLGLNFEFIYGCDYYNFKHVTFPDVYKYTKDAFLGGSPKSFGCAIGHYQAILQSYHFGYKNVLIIEDDVCFNKDISMIADMFSNVPDDADLLDFDPRCWTKENQDKMVKLINESDSNYVKIGNDIKTCGTALYAIMNRDCMELYLDNQRNYLVQSDWVKGFWEEPIINRYIPTKCVYIDQLNYQKFLIWKENNPVYYVDSLYLRDGKYTERNFFKPNVFHTCSRD